MSFEKCPRSAYLCCSRVILKINYSVGSEKETDIIADFQATHDYLRTGRITIFKRQFIPTPGLITKDPDLVNIVE